MEIAVEKKNWRTKMLKVHNFCVPQRNFVSAHKPFVFTKV